MKFPSARVLLLLSVAAAAIAQDIIDFGGADREEQDRFQQVE